jgi:hypothetical protein
MPTILIGTPTHRSTFPGTFYECLNQTERHLAGNKIRSWWICAKGCGVEWNRNKLVSFFLGSEATHLLMVDTDMAWSPRTVLRWCAADRDVIAAPYLARRVDACQWNLQPQKPPQALDPEGYVRVARAGTGLMMIRRNVLEHMSEKAEPYFETYDVERKPLRKVFYFDIDPDTRELRGEDYNFTRDVQVEGFDVWVDTDALAGHLHEVPISAGLDSLLPWLGLEAP